MLYDYQFGFLLGRSTVHTLLHFTEIPLKRITMQTHIKLEDRSWGRQWKRVIFATFCNRSLYEAFVNNEVTPLG